MLISLQLQPPASGSDLGRQQQQRADLHRLLEEDVINGHQAGPAPSAPRDDRQVLKGRTGCSDPPACARSHPKAQALAQPSS